MKVQLYNTLTKKIEAVEPVDSVVTIYTCGPTVYDYPHIGNWYAFIRWDILHRTLTIYGYKTKWIMNITDVGHLASDADEGEDKLQKGAIREGKTAWDIASYYGSYFIEGLTRLHFSEINDLPKATDHITEQIDMIQILENKGVTYTIDDGVYFDTSKIDNYGKLAQLDLQNLQAGARIEYNTQKRNVSDFALWKFSPINQHRDMEWESPWGVGFPGWHIECSAMAKKYLGDTISVHAGGIDHIPIHHTNEIAQSETANGKVFSHLWIHSNFILVNGKKMSKSADNFYTLEDIAKEGFNEEVFRFTVLSSHFQTEAEFSWNTMQSSQVRLQRFKDAAYLRFQPTATTKRHILDTSEIAKSLAQNLNTPEALSKIDQTFQSLLEEGISESQSEELLKYLEFIEKSLGIDLLATHDISDSQKNILKQRHDARANKDWEKSDTLRLALAKQHISVRDTPHGQLWSHTN